MDLLKSGSSLLGFENLYPAVHLFVDAIVGIDTDREELRTKRGHLFFRRSRGNHMRSVVPIVRPDFMFANSYVREVGFRLHVSYAVKTEYIGFSMMVPSATLRREHLEMLRHFTVEWTVWFVEC